jgi:predicted patatin/cPLA2 family phospholipase
MTKTRPSFITKQEAFADLLNAWLESFAQWVRCDIIENKEDYNHKYSKYLDLSNKVQEQYMFVKQARETIDTWIEEQKLEKVTVE